MAAFIPNIFPSVINHHTSLDTDNIVKYMSLQMRHCQRLAKKFSFFVAPKLWIEVGTKNVIQRNIQRELIKADINGVPRSNVLISKQFTARM
jgi:hypothetical protein